MDLMTYARRIAQWIYPPRCLLCDGVGMAKGAKALDICSFCYSRLPDNLSACARCALPIPPDSDNSRSRVCGHCLKKPPAFDYSVSLFRYEQPVVWLITQLKFNERLSHAKLLGEILEDVITDRLMSREVEGDAAPDCILPVPLYKKRFNSRGFNQSIELARYIANRTGLPLELSLVKRARETQAQTGLDAVQRRKNMRGAFEVVGSVEYDHVVIVDDVVTTGSTVNALAIALKRAGVKRVDVWSIARAV